MNKPFISVIIPTYNRADLIKRSVESVLEQTYSRFELIIVDDCSTDNTEEVVRAMDDPRIRYVRCDKNGGAAAARNRGIAEAKYDWIAFQDSDDVWRPEKLKKQVEAIDGVAGLIYCTFSRHDPTGEEQNVVPSEERSAQRKSGILFGELLVGNFIGMPTILVHKKVLMEAGVFDETLHNHEDYELLLRISQVTRIHHVDEVLVDVFETEGSVGFNLTNYIESISTILARYREILIETELWDFKTEQFFEITGSFGLKETAEKRLEEKIKAKTKKRSFSLIIPCHNSSEYLPECLESIRSQTTGLDDIEIIFVDDASTDGGKTLGLLYEFQKKVPDAVILRHEVNKRQGGARNTALRQAVGKYVSFLDSDDKISPDYFETLVRIIKDTDADIVQFGLTNFYKDENGDINVLDSLVFPNEVISIDDSNRKEFINSEKMMLGHPYKVYRRDMLIKAGSRFGENVVYEEPLFTYPLQYYLNKFASTSKSLYLCRQHSQSTMKTDMTDYARIWDHASQCVELFDFMKNSGFYSEYSQEIDFRFIHSFLLETMVFCGGRGFEMKLDDYEKMRKTLFSRLGTKIDNIYANKNPFYKLIVEMVYKENMTQEALNDIIKTLSELQTI